MYPRVYVVFYSGKKKLSVLSEVRIFGLSANVTSGREEEFTQWFSWLFGKVLSNADAACLGKGSITAELLPHEEATIQRRDGDLTTQKTPDAVGRWVEDPVLYSYPRRGQGCRIAEG